MDAPEAGKYRLLTRYAVALDGCSGNFVMRVNDGKPMPLNRLENTGGWHEFQWAEQGEVELKKGENHVRWDAKMGGMNFDAFVLTRDEDYQPEGADLQLPPGSVLFHAQEFDRSINDHADIR